MRRFDRWLLLGAGSLLIFGLAAITSIELSQAVEGSALLRKQLVALALGLVLAGGAATRHVQFFRAFSLQAYAVGVALLFLVLSFGRTLNGTTGWFVLGGYAFQPLEVMKIALVLRLARYFGEEMGSPFAWRSWARPVGVVALPAVLLLLQPDVGGALLLVGTAALLIFLAGLPWRALGVFLSGALMFSVPGWWLLSDGRRARILTFLDPARDPLGQGYNILQAQVAIGSGGFFGQGFGAGTQSRLQFLPESQTDFIFAVIGEELVVLCPTWPTLRL
jgi:rod shape determining protein RodA